MTRNEAMPLFDEDASGPAACGPVPARRELAGGRCAEAVDAGLRRVEAAGSATRSRRLEELPTSLPVGGIITPV